MNSDGEKMPPDDPEPRLVEVAAILRKNSNPSSQTEVVLSNQDALDRRVADAIDIVLSQRAKQHIHQAAEQQHAQHVPRISPA